MKNFFEIMGSGILWILTVTQTEQVFRIVSLVLSILISLVILISKIVEWYKKANQDGKITKDEVKILVDNVKEDLKDITENVEDLVDAINEQEKENKNND